MAAYSEEEKQAFREKDLRISRQGLIQALINSDRYTRHEIDKTTLLIETTEKYLQYIYTGALNEEDSKVGNKSNTGNINWQEVADTKGFSKPETVNLKILDSCWNQYNHLNIKDSAPETMLEYIIKKFGAYPTKLSSVETIINSLKGK